MEREEGAERDAPARHESAPSQKIRWPWITLLVGVIALVSLGVVGLDVDDQLKPTSLEIPGSDSAEAQELLEKHFGDSAPFAILLEGPRKRVDRQGPRLIRVLREDPAVTTLSPWDRGQVDRLRPSRRQALIVVDFHVGIEEAVNETVPELNETLEEVIHPPVEATQTGYATLSRAIQDESISATHRGELIALPILLIVLLLVFRSPIAAAVPLIFGGLVVFSSRGILEFFTNWMAIDGFALVVCTMMGLALGVDYALLMVSRYREELAEGGSSAHAAWSTRRTAGRTTIFAASTLSLSMAVAMLVLPGALLVSLAGTVIMVTVLSALVATVLGPAILTILAGRVNLWRIGGAAAAGGGGLMALVNGALRNPAVAAVLIGGLLLVLSAPALGLKTGPPSPEQLPPDNPVRENTEKIEEVAGPGWDAPFTVIAAANFGTITDPARMDRLVEWQQRISQIEDVQAVIGPAEIDRQTEQLQQLGYGLVNAEDGPLSELEELGRQLGRASGGVSQLRQGLSDAAYGADLLGSGADQASQGAMALASGLEQAQEGSGQAIDALEQFRDGAQALARAQEQALLGTLELRIRLQDLLSNLEDNTTPRAEALEQDLLDEVEQVELLQEAALQADSGAERALEELESMTTGQSDPNYSDAVAGAREAVEALSGNDPETGEPWRPTEAPDYEGMPEELTMLGERLDFEAAEAQELFAWLITGEAALERLSAGADRLHRGMGAMRSGTNRLADGADRLADAAGQLDSGLDQLVGGAASLADGIGLLGGGAGQLAGELSSGAEQSAPLEDGLADAQVQVLEGTDTVRRQVAGVRERSPGLFNSGHFVLAALDGAPAAEREAASEVIDLPRGGQAATLFVVPTATFNTPTSIALDDRLDKVADRIAEDTGTEAGVAGGAAQLNDYGRITTDRMPYVIAAIALATFLVLVVVLRALLLAALAVILNLMAVGVAFGVLTLLFNVPDDWPLGGTTYVDAVGATAIFGVVFGLSIDYAVFLLARMREQYDLHGDHREAIRFGLSRTAGVITGAAAIMMAVFIAFAGAPIATVSQLGIGLTVAVLLDATLIRIVLLPAMMLLFGKAVWWLPGPLERHLPKLRA